MNQSAIIVGSGIVGLAVARALSVKGFLVTVVERHGRATGASVRNFGMVWPIGQPGGKLYERAIASREVWKEISTDGAFPIDNCGSLHLAYHEDEWGVLQELAQEFRKEGRPVELKMPDDILDKFHGVNSDKLKGGLFSETESIVDPRVAIGHMPAYLSEKYGVQFIWNRLITRVEPNKIWSGENWMQADLIFICSGSELEALYPEAYSQLSLTKCKLQMMRFTSREPGFRIGTSLCGGLSLIHYDSFKVAPSLNTLKERYQQEMPQYLKAGIHVMVSQNGSGELTVGDSHEYGHTFSPFDDAGINQLIMDYLGTFAFKDNWILSQSWHGIYPKMPQGQTEVFLNPEPGVFILNGLGGAGMTLSFGLAQEIVYSL